jgi:tetratricopeptide (TPR) repeat protein
VHFVNTQRPPVRVDIVVSAESRGLSRRTKGWLIIVFVLLAATAGGGAWWWMNRSEEAPPITYDQASTEALHQSALRQYDDVITTLEEYLANVPEDKRDGKEYSDSVLSLGKAYYQDKQYDMAIARYETLLGKEDYKLDAQRGLGKAYAAKGDKARALQYLEAVVATMKTRTDPESQFRITMDEAELEAVKQ